MPISIQDNYNYINDLLSKNNGVYISPQEYTRYATVSSNEMWDDFIGRKTNPRIVLGKNRLVDTRLLPFKRKSNLSFVDEVLTKPAGCGYISAIYTTQGRIPVRPLDDDRQAKIFQDVLASPNDEDKYYVEGASQLTLLGEEDLNVTVEYYVKPTAPKYATTNTGVGGRAVFDQANSVDFEWDKSEEEELSMRILQKMGVSMRDQLEVQYSSQKINQE